MDKRLYSMINMLLWDLTIVQRNIQILHWNIKDRSFIYMHEYLEGVYDQLFKYIDMTAKQLRFDDCFPKGALCDAIKNSQIPCADSSKTYNHKQVVCLALSNILIIKNKAMEIVDYANSTKQEYSASLIASQIDYYSKVIYYLRNSLIDSCY